MQDGSVFITLGVALLGAIAALAPAVVAGIMAHGRMQARVGALEDDLRELHSKNIDARLASLETGQAHIQAALERIERRLDVRAERRD